jgi:hypothetical protein
VCRRSVAVCLALSFVTMRVRHRSKQIELSLAEAAAPVAVFRTGDYKLTLANVVIAKMQAYVLCFFPHSPVPIDKCGATAGSD